MAYAKRSDSNQQEIIDSARGIPGLTVESIHRHGHGIPDLIVGFRGINYLFEVKTEKGKLEESEQKFFDKWTGQVSIIRSIDDLLEAVGAI